MYNDIIIICCGRRYTLYGGSSSGGSSGYTKCQKEYNDLMGGGGLPPASYLARILAKNGLSPSNRNEYVICLSDLARLIRRA